MLCLFALIIFSLGAPDTEFHHQMKHLEVRQKYSTARRIFNFLLRISSCDPMKHGV